MVKETPPHIIVKRFGCTAIHNKVLYKCIIHSFNYSFIHVVYWHSWWTFSDLTPGRGRGKLRGGLINKQGETFEQGGVLCSFLRSSLQISEFYCFIAGCSVLAGKASLHWLEEISLQNHGELCFSPGIPLFKQMHAERFNRSVNHWLTTSKLTAGLWVNQFPQGENEWYFLLL